MDAAKVSTRLFPGDVVVDIMARLPVKSLKRFRSVTKSWCSLIQSGEFISAHYSHSKNKVCPLIKHKFREGKTMVSLISNSQTLDVATNFDVPIPFTTTEPCTGITMIGCCNGIVCLSYGSNGTNITLWNLATREIKTLPSYSETIQRGFLFEAMGFGYESERDDYKVVRIDDTYDFDAWCRNMIPQHTTRVALYNLTTNSWRSFDVPFTINLLERGKQVGVYTNNGVCHFWGFVHDHVHVLHSFDFSKEVFTTTPLPDPHCFCSFMEIYGSLGGLCRHYEDYDIISERFDVWVLGEIGVTNSWTKLFTTPPIFADFYLLGAGNNGELIFVNDESERNEPDSEEREVLVWHPSKQMIWSTQALGSSLQLQMYAESLVCLSK